MYNPYQRKLISDMIMNVVLSVLLIVNMLPVNIGARIAADEITTDPSEEIVEVIEGSKEEKKDEVDESKKEDVQDSENELSNTVDKKDDPDPVDGDKQINGNVNDDLSGVDDDNKSDLLEPSETDQENGTDDLGTDDQLKAVKDLAAKGAPALLGASYESSDNDQEEETSLKSVEKEGITIALPGGNNTVEYSGITLEDCKNQPISLTFDLYRNDVEWLISSAEVSSNSTAPGATATCSFDGYQLTVEIALSSNYDGGSIIIDLDGHSKGSSHSGSNPKHLQIIIPEKLTVVWQNWDETQLAIDKVEYDTTPVYEGNTPTRANGEDCYYVLKDGIRK